MITKSVRVYGEFRSTTSLQLNCLAQKYTTTDISCIVFAQSHKDILKSKTPHPPVRRRLLVNSLSHIDPVGSFICTKSRSFTFASKKSLVYTEFHWQRKQILCIKDKATFRWMQLDSTHLLRTFFSFHGHSMTEIIWNSGPRLMVDSNFMQPLKSCLGFVSLLPEKTTNYKVKIYEGYWLHFSFVCF